MSLPRRQRPARVSIASSVRTSAHVFGCVRLIFALCLTILLEGCGSARRGVPVQPPVELTEEDDLRGRRVFMRFCNGCHPAGEAGLGPGLNNKLLPGFLIKFQVRHGLGVMPSFPDEVISDEELDDLAGYLIALRHID